MFAVSDFSPISIYLCVDHPCRDELEAYSRCELAEAARDRVEEHLLLCEPCQDCVLEMEEYARVMREALKRLEP
ncbi:MAG TPA: hypothetical protein VFA04_22455 [Bryobacteraceae bacterium]|nr:hypothetical protein [Bryobacteraceae bacterium]